MKIFVVWGSGYRGKKGGGREPASCQSSSALGRQMQEDCQMLSMWPRVSIWLCEATNPTWQRVDKEQPLVPGSQPPASHAGYGRGAENRIGALGWHLSLEVWEERAGERRALGGSHTGKSL